MLDPASTVQIFQKQPDLKTVKAGDAIYHEGDVSDVMYGIIEGKVDLVKHDRLLETLEAGEVFGVGGILDMGTRLSNAIAQTDCKLAFLNEGHFLFAVQETPMFAIEVMKNYSHRLRNLAK